MIMMAISLKKSNNKNAGLFYTTLSHLIWFSLLQLVLVGCGGHVAEHEKPKPNGMIQQADYNLLEVKGPTNWEYGGWQSDKDSLVSFYARNIAIDTKPSLTAVNPYRMFMLIAIKDTVNRFYLAAEEDFFKGLSGNTIILDYNFSGAKVYGFNYQKIYFLGDTLNVINIQPASSIFDTLNQTNDLILSVELKDLGALEIAFATKGFFWSR
jgi:hypothetical protein